MGTQSKEQNQEKEYTARGMQSREQQNLKKEYMSIGLLAHVDAGKTTLSEAILHRTGAIRSAGRVDHGDAFLDTDAMERDRGITIFSKQASFTTYPGTCCCPEREDARGISGPGTPVQAGAGGSLRERIWTLVDTPGHADFSTEMERVLQVLDCAVLIISAADGVTGQVRTLWRLLDHYQVPSFLFVNKMDQPGADRDAVYARIREELGSACVDLQGERALWDRGTAGIGGLSQGGLEGGQSGLSQGGLEGGQPGLSHGGRKGGRSDENTGAKAVESDTEMLRAGSFSQQIQEEIAVCDEDLMERFFEGGEIRVADAAELVMRRRLFPVCFGSALREEGVEDLLAMLDALALAPVRGDQFGARVFKITHDANGARLTWMKITGGKLLLRQQIPESPDERGLPEKTSQLRFYKGTRFEALQEAPAGIIVAVPGLSATRAGIGLGAEAGHEEKEGLLQPVMQSRILLPPGQDLYAAFRKLRVLEEEDPMLHLSYEEEKKEITVQIMGQVQREILQRRILERFGMQVEFGAPGIVYRETIGEAAEGVGHFEPLRHYAEVHLLLEPGEPGSGLVFESRCSVNDLALNWQRLILTHLEERRHRGVLTGAEITDMKISIIGGRAHAKHTEGGDFRKATYRAVRQGLMMAKSVLLEPDYDFRLEVPQESVGHAMADLQQREAVFGQPEFQEKTGMAVLRGTVTVAALGSYAEEVAAYTRGAGSLQCSLRGYVPCKNAEAVIAASGYDPELDLRNPSSSVFCSHGAGTIIPWYEVRSFMHVDTGWRFPGEAASMTQDEALDLAAERAQKAALEREKKRRFLEGIEDEDPGQDGGPGGKSANTVNGADGINAGNTGNAGNAGNAGYAGNAWKGRGGGGNQSGGAGGPGRGGSPGRGSAGQGDAFKRRQQAVLAREKELMQIFERTYGPVNPRAGAGGGLFEDPGVSGTSGKTGKKKGASDPWGLEQMGQSGNAGPRGGSGGAAGSKGSNTDAGQKGGSGGVAAPADPAETGRGKKPQTPPDHYLLVDGYNIIFAWEDLRSLALRDIKAARDSLMDILSNFAGYRPEKVILVFDAYKVAGGPGEALRWHNIDVVFTKEAETADLYIEKTAHVLAKKYRVTVATSDAVEQVIIFGTGAYRMSAQMLLEEILFTQREMRERYGIGSDEA